MKDASAPFYAIYNVGSYTFAPFKVVWAEMAGTIGAVVVGSQALPYDLGEKPIVPDHKVYFVGTDSEEQAHFLCALLNSEPVGIFVDSFTVKLQVGTLFRHLKLPAYDPHNLRHQELVKLSKQAHNQGIDQEIQARIDTEAWAIIAVL